MRPLPKELKVENARQWNLASMYKYRDELDANIKLFEEHLVKEREKLANCLSVIEVLEQDDVGKD